MAYNNTPCLLELVTIADTPACLQWSPVTFIHSFVYLLISSSLLLLLFNIIVVAIVVVIIVIINYYYYYHLYHHHYQHNRHHHHYYDFYYYLLQFFHSVICQVLQCYRQLTINYDNLPRGTGQSLQ